MKPCNFLRRPWEFDKIQRYTQFTVRVRIPASDWWQDVLEKFEQMSETLVFPLDSPSNSF